MVDWKVANRSQFFVTGADALLFASFSSLILFVLSTLAVN
jgi:hypothetical protein